MKTKGKLNPLRSEAEAPNNTLTELTEDELEQVSGGNNLPSLEVTNEPTPEPTPKLIPVGSPGRPGPKDFPDPTRITPRWEE